MLTIADVGMDDGDATSNGSVNPRTLIASREAIRHSSVVSSQFFVEAVAYQQAAIGELERRAFAVTPMHPIKDKRAAPSCGTLHQEWDDQTSARRLEQSSHVSLLSSSSSERGRLENIPTPAASSIRT
jgi:hypothetical protein